MQTHSIFSWRTAVLVAGLVLGLAGPARVQADSCDTVDPHPTRLYAKAAGFDSLSFVNNLWADLGGKDLKGFVATVTDRYGRTVARLEHGLARTACDPGGEQDFTSSTETPWGSVSKIITTAAAIYVMETFGVDLDDPIQNHLPFRWRALLHPRFQLGEAGSGPVTLRMMLQHRGGFRHSSCGGRTIKARLLDGDLFECADDTPPPPTVGVRSYANMSQGIFQILLAYMAYPGTMLYYENTTANYNTAQYDSFIQLVTNNIYRNIVQNQIFAPIGISGVCNMAEISAADPSGNYALWYTSASDTHGALPPDQNHTCAAGAWILSSNEMAIFLHQLRHTENILSAAGAALMESSWTDSLGWWYQGWDVGTGYSHNGAWGETRAEVRALPGGLVATYVTNSGIFGSNAGALLDQTFRRSRKLGIARSMAAVRHPAL